MKKIIISALCIGSFLISYTTRATHAMGGELTVKHKMGLTHEVNLTMYRDNDPSTGSHQSMNGDYLVYIVDDNTQQHIRTKMIPVSQSGTLANYPYVVEVYSGADTLAFPYQGKFTLVTQPICCRNTSVHNSIQGAANQPLVLETKINVSQNLINSTPIFQAPIVVWLYNHTLWTYNPLVSDLDGDSLVWSIDTPLCISFPSNTLYKCPYYDTGFVNPNNSVNFSINSATGLITWHSILIGHFQTAIVVDEYRNGNWIGRVKRDMQFIVTPSQSTSTEIKYVKELEVDVYPNPAINKINVDFSKKYNGLLRINISDLTGKVIFSIPQKEFPVGQNSYSIDISSLTNGPYIISAVGYEEFFNSKFIVNK